MMIDEAMQGHTTDGQQESTQGPLNYARMLVDGFCEMRDACGGASSRLTYLSDFVFGFTTYDSEMAELFARKATEVCAAISAGKTFDYIKDPNQYRWFLVMCNMPFFAGRIEWGTSIRGAWWAHNGTTLSSDGLWSEGEQITDVMTFTESQWKEFIAALIAFCATSHLCQAA